MRERLGIAIMSWNRPHYFGQMLKTLAANDLRNCDVHLWQDGAIDSVHHHVRRCPDKLIADSVALFEAADLGAASKKVHQTEDNLNLGCAGQRWRLMPYMAKRYERFICMDNDTTLSPYAVQHMRSVLEQFDGDPRFGSVSTGFRLSCEPGERDQYRYAVTGLRGHFWCEGWWRSTWQRVWKWYTPYYEIVSGYSYHRLADGNLMNEMKEWAQDIGSVTAEPSSDTGLARGLDMEGLGRLRMIVNRATSIGSMGLHCTPGFLEKAGLGHQPLYTWEGEEDVKTFEFVWIDGLSCLPEAAQ